MHTHLHILGLQSLLWSLCGWLFSTFRGSSAYLYGARPLTIQQFLFPVFELAVFSLEALKNRHGIQFIIICYLPLPNYLLQASFCFAVFNQLNDRDRQRNTESERDRVSLRAICFLIKRK